MVSHRPLLKVSTSAPTISLCLSSRNVRKKYWALFIGEPYDFTHLQNGLILFAIQDMFEYHVISSSSKPQKSQTQHNLRFEYHVILSSSKPAAKLGINTSRFEYHVILSSSKPRMIVDVSIIVFEYHVILSSSKP